MGRTENNSVHNVLSKTGFTPPGMVFPVSAVMLRDMVRYGQALEFFSEAIARFVDYSLDAEQKMTVTNETAALYRFFEATPQAEYLFDCIEETIAPVGIRN